MRYIILMTAVVSALILILAYVLSPRCIPESPHGPKIGNMLVQGCQ